MTDAIYPALAEGVFKGTLLVTAAWALAIASRGASAAWRHRVWGLTFAALCLLPLLSLTVPSWGVAPASITISASAAASTGTSGQLAWRGWVAAVWLLGFLCMSARMWAGHWRVARALRHGPVAAPMTWGNQVLLPAEADVWPADLRRSVLLHEEAHAARGDFFWHVVVQLGECLYWFHPLVRLAAREAMREAERATDDAVLASGVEPADYASHLISVAREMRPAPEAALAVARLSTLEERIRSILARGANRRPVSRATALALFAVVSLGLVPLAAIGQQEDRVYKVDEGVTPPRLIHKVEPAYTEEARDAKIEGTVVLKVEITKEGRAENIVLKKSLDPGLDLNAIEALRQWRFEPGTIDGRPVRVLATVEVNFRLK